MALMYEVFDLETPEGDALAGLTNMSDRFRWGLPVLRLRQFTLGKGLEGAKPTVVANCYSA